MLFRSGGVAPPPPLFLYDRLVYITPEATFVDSPIEPIVVGDKVALVFCANVPYASNNIVMKGNKPSGTSFIVAFPLCYVGSVVMPLNYGDVLGAKLSPLFYTMVNLVPDEFGLWTMALFIGNEGISRQVTLRVHPF